MRPSSPSAFAVLFAAVLASEAALGQVTVSEAWVRGTVAGQKVTGAFMKLAPADDATLVSASSPIASSVEIHEMKHEGGVMKMRAVDRLPLAKGRVVALEPGGYHVMLVGLTKAVNAGDDVPIALTFEDRQGKRSVVEVVAKVRALAAGGPMKH
jgi:periplasmic copper chaperone A